MKTYFPLLILWLLLAVSCKQNAVTVSPSADSQVLLNEAVSHRIAYSALLNIEMVDGYALCSIRDPWRSERTVMQYLLVPRDDSSWSEERQRDIEARHGQSCVLRTPLQRMTLTTSCHAWLLSQLGALDKVAVLCDTAYIHADNVRRWMRQRRADGSPMVADGGSAMMPNTEVILSAGSDAVWISPFENTASGAIGMIPVPVIYCADYMETSPLGRADWMKFYGRLVGRGEEADRLFAEVATRYTACIDSTRTAGPMLLAETPYGATWYVPGGNSTSALLYQDAGYTYPWAQDRHAGSLALSKEAVLAQAQPCDLWLVKYEAAEGEISLSQFLAGDEIYGLFKAAQTRQVWGCNTATSDLFDVTPFRPDTLLASLQNMDGKFYQLLQ